MTIRVSSKLKKVPVFLGLLFILTNCVQKNRNLSSTEEPAIPGNISDSNTQPSTGFTYSETDPIEAYNRRTSFARCSFQKKKNFQFDNTYLHFDIIDQVPRSYLVRHEKQWSKKIPIRCIQFAQQNYGGSFARCEDSDSEIVTEGVPMPCLNETYTNYVYNAYHDVHECFGLDPKKSFLQIYIESGFHINAININKKNPKKSGFDAGIGQFTKNGILRVGHDLINRVSGILTESTNPSCARIANIMGKLEPDDFELKNRCSVIAAPENPYRSLVMHYLHGLRDKVYFEADFFDKRPELVGIVDDEIIQQLVMLAYNRGITGTLRLVDGYVAYLKAGKQTLTTEKFNLWKNVNAAIKIMKGDERYRDYLLSVIRNGAAHKKHTTMTFAEYLAVQDKTYMAQMVRAKERVDGHFGPGTCY